MKESEYMPLIHAAFLELFDALANEQERRSQQHTKRSLCSGLWYLTQKSLQDALHELRSALPDDDDARFRTIVSQLHTVARRLDGRSQKPLRLLESCLRKQRLLVHEESKSLGEFVSLPAFQAIETEPMISPRRKFRVLVQRFARRVFDESQGGITHREDMEREVCTEAVSFVVSKVFGMDSLSYGVSCIRSLGGNADTIREAKDGIEEFCRLLLRELFSESEHAVAQLFELYGEVIIVDPER